MSRYIYIYIFTCKFIILEGDKVDAGLHKVFETESFLGAIKYIF